MEALRTVLAIIVVLLTVVIVHELGHYIVAKRSGIQVDEFAVGFGPKLIWRRVGETVYALRLIPAGGFVRLAGMMDIPGVERDPGPRAFFRASIPARTATILAGGVFNLVFAGIVFSILAMPGQASSVPSWSPLHAAGLRDGDEIVSVNGVSVNRSDAQSVTTDMHGVTNATEGHPAQVVYLTPSGARRTTTVHPFLVLLNGDRSNKLPDQMAVDSIDGAPVGPGDPQALFGKGGTVKVAGHQIDDPNTRFNGTVSGVSDGDGAIGKAQAGWRFGFTPGWEGNSLPFALGRGFTRVPTTIADTFSGLYQIITTPNSGGISGNVQGPVGIVRQTGDAASAGGLAFLEWIGFLSLNLGVFNLLPIPFLDGGRFVFIALEAVRHRRLDPRREAAIHYVGLMLILALVFYVTFTGDIGSRS